jgi:hypothetical protein
MTITARDIIEACAKVADEWATPEQRLHGNGGPAAALRRLADQYGNAILCEPEPVAWLNEESGYTFNARSKAIASAKQLPSWDKYTEPLYRAKEPT